MFDWVMAGISTVAPSAASGLWKRQYDARLRSEADAIPQRMTAGDLGPLCDQGFDDEAISEIVQITGLFADYNRLADGLGIDDEPEWSEAR